jgi:hypothetical protein
MNKLPPGAGRLLEQARQSDRAHQVDLDATLHSLHAALPFADAGPLSAPSSGQGADAASGPGNAPPSMPRPTGIEALAGGALLGGKAVKVFLATVALGGAVGGASLLGAPARQADSRAREVPAMAASRPEQVARGATEQVDEATAKQTAPVVQAQLPDRADTHPGKVRSPRAVSKSAAPSAAGLAAGAPPAQSARRQTAVAAATQESAPRAVPVEVAESELDLIDAALVQLRSGSGTGALTLLDRHATQYPRGRFRTEREGLRVLALCESGRLAEGHSAQARFLHSASDAPIAAQVRVACVEKGSR